MKTPKRLLTLFTSLLILALIASASIASSGATTDHATTSTEGVAVPRPGSGAAEDEEDPADEETDEDEATDEDPEREAACNEVAGIEPAPEEEGVEDSTTIDETDVPEKLHGLDNAVARVLANCIKNPQAPGLLNALEHLVANQAKHEAHETWKAEKAEARAEAKAAKHAEGSGHGSTGEHGNPHEDQAHGNPHGEGGNGHSGSHGNGH